MQSSLQDGAGGATGTQPSALRPAKRSRPRRLLVGGATALASALLALVLLEVAYRRSRGIPLTGGILYQDQMRFPDDALAQEPWFRDLLATFRPSADPVLFYEPRPGYRGFFPDARGFGPGEEIAISSQGLRDREYALAKDPGTFRIVVLGDSIVWGHRLALQDSFPKQLERLLGEASARPIEVLNLGVSGYSTEQEVELYRVKASLFQPDLVIVGYCLNDYEESSVEGRVFRRLYYDVFTRSYVLERLKHILRGLSEVHLGLSFTDEEKQSGLRASFERLRALCGERKVLVVIFPELSDFRHYLPLSLHKLVVDALHGLDFAVLDLLGPFGRFEPEDLRLHESDRTHPNAFGMRVAAEATRDLLLRERLVPVENPSDR